MALEKVTETKHDLKDKNHETSAIAAKKNVKDRLVCVSCGMAVEVNYPLTEDSQMEVEKVSGFHPQSHRIVLYGYCQDCSCNFN